MVGANHPTLADTLNRLFMVNGNEDGSLNQAMLEEQTSAPTVASGYAAIYAKLDDSSVLRLWQVDENANPYQIVTANDMVLDSSGIAGLVQERTAYNQYTVSAGAVMIAGTLYTLASAATVSAGSPPTTTGLYPIYVTAPSGRTALINTDFHVGASFASEQTIERGAHGGWYMLSQPTQRVIGFAACSSVASGLDYWTNSGGFLTYTLYGTEDTSPGTTYDSGAEVVLHVPRLGIGGLARVNLQIAGGASYSVVSRMPGRDEIVGRCGSDGKVYSSILLPLRDGYGTDADRLSMYLQLARGGTTVTSVKINSGGTAIPSGMARN